MVKSVSGNLIECLDLIGNMTPEKIILLIVFIPLFGSFLLPVVRCFFSFCTMSPKARPEDLPENGEGRTNDRRVAAAASSGTTGMLSLAFIVSSLFLSLMLVPGAVSGARTLVSTRTVIGNVIFQGDMLAVYMATIASMTGAIIIFYSLGFMRNTRHETEYYFMSVIAIGSALGVIFSGNMIVMYVFGEITTFACYRLIGLNREDSVVSRADKFFLINMFGSVFLLAGIFAIHGQTGSFDFSALKAGLTETPIPNLAVFLILIGIFAKSAVIPMHTWFPDAGVSPIPVMALLHSVILVKIGIYIYVRLLVSEFPIDPIWGKAIPLIAGISALIAAGVALVETDIRRILGYAAISQTGFILFGFSTGNAIGIAGGMLFLLMSALSGSCLLLCAGIIERNAHSLDITRLGGLFEVMPVTGVSFLLCSFSLIGIPPLGGFFSQYLVISGAALDHSLVTLLFGLVILINSIFILRLFSKVFLGEQKTMATGEGSSAMVGSVLVLSVLTVLGGLLINFPSELVQVAVSQMLGIQ